MKESALVVYQPGFSQGTNKCFVLISLHQVSLYHLPQNIILYFSKTLSCFFVHVLNLAGKELVIS